MTFFFLSLLYWYQLYCTVLYNIPLYPNSIIKGPPPPSNHRSALNSGRVINIFLFLLAHTHFTHTGGKLKVELATCHLPAISVLEEIT